MRFRRPSFRLIAPAAFVALSAIAAPAASAQQYFGQNQVQYQEFDWQVIKTEHIVCLFEDLYNALFGSSA